MERGKWLKTISLAVSLLMLLTLLAACKKEKGNDSNTTAQGNTTAQTQSTNDTAEDDLGWKNNTDPITFDWYVAYDGWVAKWGQDITSKYITEKTGVTLNLITPNGNMEEQVSLMVASADIPDIVSIEGWDDNVYVMAEGDLVYSLQELADAYEPKFYDVHFDSMMNWFKLEDGKTYGIPSHAVPPEMVNKDLKLEGHQTFLVRKDIYEAIGKPDMRTPDGFLNALKTAAEEFPEINGQPLIPLGFNEFTSDGCNALQATLYEWLALPYEKDGNYYRRDLDPDYIMWLKTLRKANEMGLINKSVFVDKLSQVDEKVAQGRYFALMVSVSDIINGMGALYASDPDKTYIAIDPPANSKLDTPELYGGGITGWLYTMVSKECKDPERAIQFITYWWSEEGQRDFFLGKQGETWDVIDGKEQLLPEVIKMMEEDNSGAMLKYGCYDTYPMLTNKAMVLKWWPERSEPFKQPYEWTMGKVISAFEYRRLYPRGDSPEAILYKESMQKWGEVLPKLVLAESDEEFDRLFDEWRAFDIEAEKSYGPIYQENMLKNKAKLGK